MYTGIVDIGSNTIRLIVYNITDGIPEKIFSKKETAGLANYNTEGYLSDEGYEILESSLRMMKKITDELHICQVYYFATASLRNISNTEQVVSRIKDSLDIDIEIISSEMEGYLSFYALNRFFKPYGKNNMIICDIGGGSSEVLIYENSSIVENISLPCGSLNLYNRYVKEILPDRKEISAIRKEIRKQLSKISAEGSYPLLIGVGGTFRFIPALIGRKDRKFDAYQLFELLGTYRVSDDDQINRLTADAVHPLSKKILREKPDRIHTAIPGMLIAEEILKRWNVSEVLTDRISVRDGYLMMKLDGGK